MKMSDNFINYMDYIVNHKAYEGLPYEKKQDGTIKWLAPKNTKLGKERLEWANNKGEILGIDQNSNGFYAKVMYEIHPTKNKVCQICGEIMSLDYVYPNKQLVKKLVNRHNYVPDNFDTIYDVVRHFKNENKTESDIIKILKNLSNLRGNYYDTDELVEELIKESRAGNKKTLGPGAMSNFPDRFDGFHSYNRCCRSKNDKGRSAENMKSYNKDRRAYENWSDGNIHAANKFMNSNHFKDLSADHIGPISLGFKHDPRFMQKMSSGDNSSKRDKLIHSDVEKLINLERQYGVSPVSWFADLIWKDLVINYNKDTSDLELYRKLFKQNMINYMEIINIIISEAGESGRYFLEKSFLEPKKVYFNYDYTFDENK